MATNGWYVARADECERLAGIAGDPRSRAEYKHKARMWRQIAAEIAANDKARTDPSA